MTEREIRAAASARAAQINAMPEGAEKRSLRRVSRIISAGERLSLDLQRLKSGRMLAPSRLRQLLGIRDARQKNT